MLGFVIWDGHCKINLSGLVWLKSCFEIARTHDEVAGVLELRPTSVERQLNDGPTRIDMNGIEEEIEEQFRL
jgi:hypothetical protein